MDYREEYDSIAALSDLLRWGLTELGPTWADAVDATAIAATYRSRSECCLDPWQAIGLEVHMPTRSHETAGLDFGFMAWESPGILSAPAQWRFDAELAPMRIAPTHRFLEFDAQAGDIRYMGQFWSVTDASPESLPAGLLRNMGLALGRAPVTAALIEGRGGRWPGAVFPVHTAAEWKQMAEVIREIGIGALWGDQLAALQTLLAEAKAVHVGVAVDDRGRPVPMVGFEFFGLPCSEATRSAFASAGVPAASIEVFESLHSRLPRLSMRSVPLIEGVPMEAPWQRRYLHLSHTKVNLRPDGARLKMYVRLDSAGPSGFVSRGAEGLPEVAAVRAEMRRSLRAGSHTDSPRIDALREKIGFADVAIPMVRGLWNNALATVPSSHLPLFTPVARDAVVSAGVQRLSTQLAYALLHTTIAPRSDGKQLLHDLGIAEVLAEPAPSEQVEQIVRGVLAGSASTAILEHLDFVVIPAAVDWVESWREIAGRVAADRDGLWEAFGIPIDAPLIGVRADAGDRHAGGRAVHLLWFAVGDQSVGIVYKPRDLRLDAAWYALASSVMRSFADAPASWPTVLVRDGYGYVSVVAESVPVDAKIYSLNAGRVLAILHMCDARDVHADNVIQTATAPVPIDLECLWSTAEDERMLHDGVPVGTLAAIGFLPFWVRSAEGRWKNGGGIRSLVASNGTEVTTTRLPTGAPPLPDAEEIRIGFEEMYRLAMTEKGRALLEQCRFASMGADRRRVLRATRVYAGLNIELAKSAPGRSARAENLRRLTERLGQFASVATLDDAQCQLEVTSIARGDLPRFTAPVSEADVARRPIESDLAWQLTVLDEWSSGVSGSSDCAANRLAAGWKVSPNGENGWFGWEGPASAPVRQLRWLPWTLYAGALGPLLSLAVTRAFEPGSHAEAVLRQALPVYRVAGSKALAQARSFRWGLEGLSGHLRAIEALIALGVDDKGGLREVREAWIRAASRSNPAEAPLDFTTGLAGTIGPLCRWLEQGPSEETRHLVERIATELARRVSLTTLVPSMAHGYAGIGLALIEAGCHLNRHDWIDRATELWTAEADHSNPALSLSWCRGFSGIALSRALACKRLPSHPHADQWQQVVDNAVPRLAASLSEHASGSAALSLCCGAIGRLATLRILGHAPAMPEWRAVEQALIQRGRDIPPGLWTGWAGLVVAEHAPADVLARLIS